MGLTNKTASIILAVIGLSPFSLLFAQQPNSINFAEHVAPVSYTHLTLPTNREV